MLFPLFTERLRISPLTLADLDAFVEYRRDPQVARFQGWGTTFSQADAIRLIESQVGVSIPGKGDWVQLALHDRDSGELLGDLALHSVAEGDGVFEIGFTIAPEHQGQGYATEAASRLVEYLFVECDAMKIVSQSDGRNRPSINVLMKLGFVLDPSQCWLETIKGEQVEIDYFEKRGPSVSPFS